ncbi:MAG: carboxypeptidase regulatory-like domain-containing protein [Acidobacteria bacterium]|nr:carboxypeptidase regulatory-like domain-containing protein [Acidobacteriota bacterium]
MRSLKIFALALLLPCLSAFAASQLEGVVTNGTNHKPSAGDQVTLIRLAQGMQESTHTTTDAKGHFTLDVPDEGMHLVRVTHEKAAYFRPVPPGTQSVEVEVFEAAPKVKGVTLEANIVKVQTDESGKTLRMVENFFVKNDSKPPMTQFSERAFEFTLPDGAVVEGSAALAPGGMPVRSAPVPLAEKNHYAFIFPIRPGETRFQVSYRLPYNGSFQYATTPSMPVDTFVVIAAKSMKVDTAGTPLTSVQDEVDAQTYIAHNIPAKAMSFGVSGTGQLPRQTDTPEGQPSAGGQAGPMQGGAQAAADDNRPGGGMANPIDKPDPLTKYKWWILGGLAILLAVGAGFMMRPAAATPVATATAPLAHPVAFTAPAVSLQTVLRDELFQLEADKLSGKISEEEYAQLRSAFDLLFRRAMTRNEQHPPSSTNV